MDDFFPFFFFETERLDQESLNSAALGSSSQMLLSGTDSSAGNDSKPVSSSYVIASDIGEVVGLGAVSGATRPAGRWLIRRASLA